jgi:multidrug transporter EmrE-like cation transporter
MVGPGWSTIVQVLRSPIVMGGLALYGGSAILWLGVLSKVPVSRAYPFAALAVVLTTLAGRFLLGEPLGGVQIVGISLICIGVVLLGSV